MYLGLAAWGLREETLENQLEIASTLGIDLLELSIAGYERDRLQVWSTDEDIEKVKALFAKYNVRLECACTGNDFTLDDVPAQIGRVKSVINICSKLGVRFLRIFAGFTSDSVVIEERFETMMKALKEVNDYAKTKNVTLCCETHGGVTTLKNGALVHFSSPTTRVDLWKEILKTGVSICYDPANLAAVGAICPVKFYTDFAENIKYVHLKDFKDVPGGVTPVACGEGRLDWHMLAVAMKKYNGPALIEYELTGDVKDGMERSINFLKKYGF
jgi:sugar phosphate isomerase/epimerase